MHELSIASAILDLARRHVPDGSTLCAVRLVAGPMRAIEPSAMQFAWEAVLADAGLEAVRLELDLRPWTLSCPDCGRQWHADDLECRCTCGGERAFPVGGDELQVASIEVDENPKGAVPCASLSSKM